MNRRVASVDQGAKVLLDAGRVVAAQSMLLGSG
jgi:hypothetical protein